jgi:MOSC domain-containing protein YiiM
MARPKAAAPRKELPARLVSVRVGLVARHPRPKWDKARGTTWSSAFVKSPVSGPVAVGPEGLAGDQQYDRRGHGGVEMAVLAYSDNHYEKWRDELDLQEMGPGGFGENLTVENLDEESVCIGDVWAVGDARLQVSSPRGPCANISRRWDLPDLMEMVVRNGRSGWYLRVLTPGTLAVRQPVKRIERPNPDFPVARVFRLRYRQETDAAAVKKLIACKELSPEWRERFAAPPPPPPPDPEVAPTE